jgi:hypothetical protein
MDLNGIESQVLLVMCGLAAAKRHFAQISGWKSLALIAVLAIGVAYAVAFWDTPLPPHLEPLRQAAKVLVYAVGGHAYISGALKKLGGGAATTNVASVLSAMLGSGGDKGGDGFAREEQPTKPEGRSLPPTVSKGDDTPSR